MRKRLIVIAFALSIIGSVAFGAFLEASLSSPARAAQPWQTQKFNDNTEVVNKFLATLDPSCSVQVVPYNWGGNPSESSAWVTYRC